MVSPQSLIDTGHYTYFGAGFSIIRDSLANSKYGNLYSKGSTSHTVQGQTRAYTPTPM